MGSEKKPKFKQTEIGLIPEDWDIKNFSEVIIEKTRTQVNYVHKPGTSPQIASHQSFSVMASPRITIS